MTVPADPVSSAPDWFCRWGPLSLDWPSPEPSTAGGRSRWSETALDVTAYAAHIAAQLGAHIIKVKLPSAHLELALTKQVYEMHPFPRETLTERVAHVVQSTFNGRRIVIFSRGRQEG